MDIKTLKYNILGEIRRLFPKGRWNETKNEIAKILDVSMSQCYKYLYAKKEETNLNLSPMQMKNIADLLSNKSGERVSIMDLMNL